MRFFFTEEDRLTRRRASDVRAALVHGRHVVMHGRPGESAPRGTDVWMHGLGVDGAPPLDEQTVSRLLASPARLVLFQVCDAQNMSFDRIPGALAARTQLFLRNHWPSDESKIPPAYRARTGWLPPMGASIRVRSGRRLGERPNGAVFFGSRTGHARPYPHWNAREAAVRIMRSSGLPFLGGMLRHEEERYRTDPTLLVPRLTASAHARLLRESKICLAPWGNHALTYRFFEGLAARCLVLAQYLRGCRFLDGGLEPGRHYVEIAADLGDLEEKVAYYLGHLEDAQRIADAGHEHYRRYLAFRGPLVSKWTFDAAVASWGPLYRPSDATGLATVIRSVAARHLGW